MNMTWQQKVDLNGDVLFEEVPDDSKCEGHNYCSLPKNKNMNKNTDNHVLLLAMLLSVWLALLLLVPLP